MIHPSSYENVSQAVDRAFELFPLTIPGEKVLIKPNVLRSPETKEGIVTNPAVLRAVCFCCQEMCPEKVITLR